MQRILAAGLWHGSAFSSCSLTKLVSFIAPSDPSLLFTQASVVYDGSSRVNLNQKWRLRLLQHLVDEIAPQRAAAF